MSNGIRHNTQNFINMLRKLRWRYFPRQISSDPVIVSEITLLGLNHNDIVIDCGANIGRITQILAETQAKVYAFEPDPQNFWVLEHRMRKYPNVTCIPSAVSTQDDHMQLYMHVNSRENPIKWGVGSSLVAKKSNVDATNYVEVKTVDFAQFIIDLNATVAFIKMDIECYEYAVLKHLIQTDIIDNISLMRVEPHNCEGIQDDRDWVEVAIERLQLANKIRFDWD